MRMLLYYGSIFGSMRAWPRFDCYEMKEPKLGFWKKVKEMDDVMAGGGEETNLILGGQSSNQSQLLRLESVSSYHGGQTLPTKMSHQNYVITVKIKKKFCPFKNSLHT